MPDDKTGLGRHLLDSIEAAEGSEPEAEPQPRRPEWIEVERTGEGLTMRIAPRGLVRGGKGWFWIALVMFLLPLVLLKATIAAISGEPMVTESGDVVPWWLPLPFLAAFWIGATFSLYRAIQVGTEATIIDVIDGRILITTATLLRKRQRSWSRDELKAIRVGRANFGDNDELYWQLQIIDRDKEGIALLPGRPREELAWIAIEVDKALAQE